MITFRLAVVLARLAPTAAMGGSAGGHLAGSTAFLEEFDEKVPLATAEAFAAAMKKVGIRCELVVAEGQAHGFFNREPWRSKTLADADAFLESLGWIEADAPAPAR